MTTTEQRQILNLLAEGKLSVDDAERLLSALSGGGAGVARASEPAPSKGPSACPAPPRASAARDAHGFLAGDVANLALIGVTPEYIERMRETGLTGITASQLQGLAPLGVTREYVTELQALGVTDLDAGSVQGMFAVGVTP